mgnify:CR=1 FL=1
MSIANNENPTYVMSTTEKRVIVESNFYVPFEPNILKGDLSKKALQLRQDIRNAILKLKIENREILLASYSENDKSRFYDVENMLFYNIGGTAFGKISPEQLAFLGDENRFFSDEDVPSAIGNRFFYSYEVVSMKSVERLIESKKVLAHWNNIDIDERIVNRPTRYYATVRENSNKIEVNEVLNGKELFGMKIEITIPYSSHPAATMKPLLDGIICAFHGEDGVVKEVLRDIFMTRTEQMLSDTNRLNIFGNREYLKRYRGHNSFKWNPEDERLQFAWVIVKRGQASLMKGSIYKW